MNNSCALRLGLAPLLLVVCASSWGESIDELLELLVGDFDNRAQYEAQFANAGALAAQGEEKRSAAGASPSDGDNGEPQFSHLGLQRRLVQVPALGDIVVYAQINRRADPTDVYRQSFQRFSVNADGTIGARNYRFTDPRAHKDILKHPERFAALTAQELTPSLPESCDPRWTFEDGVWVSRIDRENCVITSRRDGKPRHIQATEFVEATRIRNEESGYDADGRMIFGLPPDTYYHYDRLTPEQN